KKGRQTVHQIARRGCQAYSDIEFGPVEREQKRIRVDESEAVEEASPLTIPPYTSVHISPNGTLYKTQQELNHILKSTTSELQLLNHQESSFKSKIVKFTLKI
ncbi:7807_t:CDS:1, partial [Paraglomus occultum]